METVAARSTVLRYYALFSITLIVSFLPYAIPSTIGLVLSIFVLIACYSTRRKSRDDIFIESHLTLIIRKFWVGSTLMVLTSLFASYYLYANVNNAPLTSCVNNLGHVMSTPDPEKFAVDTLKPCIQPYVDANMRTFIIAALISFGPGLLYIVLEYIRGFYLALKSQPAPDKRSAR